MYSCTICTFYFALVLNLLIVIAVCDGSMYADASPYYNLTFNNESLYLGGNVSVSCREGMALENGSLNATLLCSQTENGYGFVPTQPCKSMSNYPDFRFYFGLLKIFTREYLFRSRVLESPSSPL